MNIYAHFSEVLTRHITRLADAGELPSGLDLSSVAVEPPRDPSHGDIASNAALVLAKPAGMKPRDIADKLAASLRGEDAVEAVEVAGPGFINLRLDPAFLIARLPEILRQGASYGDSKLGGGRPVNVEYVSANPTGPMHVGHCRGAVFGDALANLLAKAGYAVTREYYINDAGAQVDVLARSAFLRYREALGEDIGEIPQGFYPGEYLKDVGLALVSVFGRTIREMDEAEWLPIVRSFAIEAMMKMIKDDLAALGIRHDVFFSERSLHDDGRVQEALDSLASRDLIYTGVLEPPKGKTPDDWEPRPQVLFKATQFGDDVDRPLKKSDGSSPASARRVICRV
ncbi:MAG TPA: arginine--tRNA ligase, partial [Sphingomonadales bacterium]